jgi:hypothetical protein
MRTGGILQGRGTTDQHKTKVAVHEPAADPTPWGLPGDAGVLYGRRASALAPAGPVFAESDASAGSWFQRSFASYAGSSEG